MYTSIIHVTKNVFHRGANHPNLERIHLLCGKLFPPENSFQQFLWKIFSTVFAGKYFPPFFGL